MSLATLLLLAAALGTDAFSMSIGVGIVGVNWRQVLIISLTILLFHIVMPLAGCYLGGVFGSLAGKTASTIGALILIYLGLRMAWGSRRGEPGSQVNPGSLSGWGLFLLSAGVSMDALSAGFSLGTRQDNMLSAAVTIGVIAGLMTFTGLRFGQLLGGIVGKRAQLIGGIVLLGIGAHMLFG